MASVIPAFLQVMQDPSLRGHPREVYLWLHQNLDVVDYRAVKHSEIEVALRMDDSGVTRAIARLLDAQYIARGAREGRLWTYRLIYSQPAASRQMRAEVAT